MSTTGSEDYDDRSPQLVPFLWTIDSESIEREAYVLPPVGDLANILYAKRMYMQTQQKRGVVIVWTADIDDEENEDGLLMVCIVNHERARRATGEESEEFVHRLSSAHWEYLKASPPSDFECLNATRILVSTKDRTINYFFGDDFPTYSLEEMMGGVSSELGLDGQDIFAVIANSWINRSERGEGNLISGYYRPHREPSFVSQSSKLTKKRLKRKNLYDQARGYLCTRSRSSLTPSDGR